MIILMCAICKNDDLLPGNYSSQFYCSGCEKILELWEIRYKKFTYPTIEVVDAPEETTNTQD